jgi:hypothetical protein
MSKSIPRPVLFVGEGHILSFTDHDAILQTLDRDTNSNGIFMAKERFEKNLDAWNSVPLIFVDGEHAEHPKPDAFDRDPDAELKRIGGRILDGHASDTRIELAGHPRLMCTLSIDDETVNAGIEAGEISISTGMTVPHDDKTLLGDVTPHHILFFKEGPTSQPGDQGAFILNTDDQEKGLRAKLLELLGVKPGKVENMAPAKPDKKEEENMAEKELDKLADTERKLAETQLAFTAAKGESAAKDAEIARLKAENLAFAQKEKDAKWLGFVAKHVPPGMVAGEKEKDARKEFEADPLAFMEKVLEFKAANPETKQSGMEFTKGAKPKKIEDALADVGVPAIIDMNGGD